MWTAMAGRKRHKSQLQKQAAEASKVEHPVLAVQQKRLFAMERTNIDAIFTKFSERRKRMHRWQKNHLFQFHHVI